MKSPLNVVLFARLCDENGLPRPLAEVRFHPTRKWRFDLAWVEHKIALEVHGGQFFAGRHTRGVGAIKDWEKMNAAQLLGWIVIQVPRSFKGSDTWLHHPTFTMLSEAFLLRGYFDDPSIPGLAARSGVDSPVRCGG